MDVGFYKLHRDNGQLEGEGGLVNEQITPHNPEAPSLQAYTSAMDCKKLGN